ncbi:hypothetical protein H9P43_000230 [Blastocladiella emersonii ATCC 22665]|nr:hypothetical protein H9P43_000230 [Blastocladiella emersonii ATCC 22665]
MWTGRLHHAWDTVLLALYGGCATALTARLSPRGFLEIVEAAAYFELPALESACLNYYAWLLAEFTAVAHPDDLGQADALVKFFTRVITYETRAAPGTSTPLLSMTIAHLQFLGPCPVTRAIFGGCPAFIKLKVVLSPKFFAPSEFARFEFLCEMGHPTQLHRP